MTSAAMTIDEILAAARSRLARLSPARRGGRPTGGAVLVDIRPQAQRAAEGEIPGAMIVERNVLEWRFDPASAAPPAAGQLRPAGHRRSARRATPPAWPPPRSRTWACTGRPTWRAASAPGGPPACR